MEDKLVNLAFDAKLVELPTTISEVLSVKETGHIVQAYHDPHPHLVVHANCAVDGEQVLLGPVSRDGSYLKL